MMSYMKGMNASSTCTFRPESTTALYSSPIAFATAFSAASLEP